MNGNIPSRVRNDESGQTLIESALVFGFLIILVIGMLEMSLFLYNYAVLTDAAKEGVRYAIVHGSSTGTLVSGDVESAPWPPCTTPADGGVLTTVRAFLAASAHKTKASDMSVYLCYPNGNNNPGSGVQVSVSYPYTPLFLGSTYWTTATISATSAGRIQF